MTIRSLSYDELSLCLSYLDAKSLARMGATSRYFRKRCNKEDLWKRLYETAHPAPMPNPLNKEWKKHYFQYYALDAQCQRIAEAARARGAFYNTFFGGIGGTLGITSFAFESFGKCGEIYTKGWELVDFCSTSLQVLQSEKLRRTMESFGLSIVQVKEKTTEYTIDQKWDCLTDLIHKMEKDYGDIPWRACFPVPLYECQCLMAICTTAILFAANIGVDIANRDDVGVKLLNILGGSFISFFGATAILMESEVIGPLFFSSGVFYIFKGVVPPPVWSRGLGTAIGKLCSLSWRIAHCAKEYFKRSGQ